MITKYLVIPGSLLIFLALIVTGCGPEMAKTGDTVKVHYTLTLTDGTEFDTTLGSEPLEFTLGQGEVIDGFEQAIIGMKAGESKTFTLTADQAYGERSDDLVFEIGRDEMPPDITPEAGMQLQTSQGIITIVEVTETTIKIDANHPLAGQDLTFDIELVEIGGPQSQGSTLTSMPLEKALSSGKPTLAEFGSTTCVPCKQMKPILEDLSVEYKDRLNVVIIEVYDERELAQQYEIMAIPTQVIFDGTGKEITRHVGFWAKDDVISQLKEMGIE